MSFYDETLSSLHTKIKNKEVTITELTEQSFKRIKETDDKIHAFLTLDEERALAKARELDEQEADNLFFGIPAGIKDNIVTKGLRTTCGSQLLDNFEPVHDATVMNRLNEKNVVTVGKLNMDEFAMVHQMRTQVMLQHVTRGTLTTYQVVLVVDRLQPLQLDKFHLHSDRIRVVQFVSRHHFVVL